MKPEDVERIKDLLPTTLGSDEYRGKIAADILRRSIVSARMASVTYLAKIRDVCTELSAGRINAAKAREALLNVLSQIGYWTNSVVTSWSVTNTVPVVGTAITNNVSTNAFLSPGDTIFTPSTDTFRGKLLIYTEN